MAHRVQRLLRAEDGLMAYYSGSVNSFGDLLTALFDSCIAEGWTLNDDVLIKGAAYVRATVSNVDTTSTGIGIILQGGTGYSAGTLVDPSPMTPRLGTPSRNTGLITWPAEYFIHIFDNPDEVFMVVRYSVDHFLWLAFGLSTVPGLLGSGLWLSAINKRFRGNTGPAITIGETSGGTSGNDHASATYAASSGAPFWNTESRTSGSSHQDAVCSGLDGVLWPMRTSNGSITEGSVQAIELAAPLISQSPNAWNGESPLIPIQAYVWRASNNCSLVVDIRNARYLRLDNYEPGQIITLGPDSYRVYPFYRKNIVEKNGGSGVDHTGTFGWAIRYDGP